jgi:hypothetical protein
VADMQDVYGLSDYGKKKTIGAPVARAEEQLADRFIERAALRGQGTGFGVMGQTLDTLACPSNPLASGARGVLTDVTIDRAEIGLSFGGKDYTINHPEPSGFSFEFSQHVICSPAFTFSGLAKAPAYTRKRIEVIGNFLVRYCVEQDGLDFAIDGEH